MANIKSAVKRARQNPQSNKHNSYFRSRYRTAIKKVVAVIEAGDHVQANTLFTQAQKVIDQVAQKGLLHKNKASRLKSRLNQRIKALAPG